MPPSDTSARLDALEEAVKELKETLTKHQTSSDSNFKQLQEHLNTMENQLQENTRQILVLLTKALQGFGIFVLFAFAILAALSGISTRLSDGTHGVEIGGTKNTAPIAAPPAP